MKRNFFLYGVYTMHKYNVDFYATTSGRRVAVGEIVVEAENAIEAIPLAVDELNIDCALYEHQDLEIKVERIWA